MSRRHRRRRDCGEFPGRDSSIWRSRPMNIVAVGSHEQDMPEEAGRVEVSVVMPCLNEAETLETCIRKALDFFARSRVSGEVVVADNGSTDGSIDIARRAGARVVHVEKKGYGNAVMGDADDSYDFQNLMPFIEKLRAGYDVVMGNRFRGGIKKGAMPWHHKYIGNPVLTGVLNLFFRSGIGDA